MVSYTITISMALIFAQKLNYKINSNQELLAMVRNFIIILSKCIKYHYADFAFAIPGFEQCIRFILLVYASVSIFK